MRRSTLTAVFFAVTVFGPACLYAQVADVVYASSDLDVPPKLATPALASRWLQEAYPDALRRAGIGGTVQVQCVVSSSGRVEEGSIRVIEAPVEALGDAAKRVVTRMTFKPGQYRGQPVRARVLLPLVFKSLH
ncbi:MAG: energy transducer TonB [Gemmatimonadaceae bacterium]